MGWLYCFLTFDIWIRFCAIEEMGCFYLRVCRSALRHCNGDRKSCRTRPSRLTAFPYRAIPAAAGGDLMGIVLVFGWIECEYGVVALGAGKAAGVQADALDGTAV